MTFSSIEGFGDKARPFHKTFTVLFPVTYVHVTRIGNPADGGDEMFGAPRLFRQA